MRILQQALGSLGSLGSCSPGVTQHPRGALWGGEVPSVTLGAESWAGAAGEGPGRIPKGWIPKGSQRFQGKCDPPAAQILLFPLSSGVSSASKASLSVSSRKLPLFFFLFPVGNKGALFCFAKCPRKENRALEGAAPWPQQLLRESQALCDCPWPCAPKMRNF